MSERVHPDGDTADRAAAMPSSPSKQPPVPPEERTKHPSGTYVIQVPKDQIYRVPTEETAQRYEEYTRRRRRGSCCCRVLLWLAGVTLALVLALGITAGVLYLVLRPKVPSYTVEGVSVRGFNLSSPQALSPEFDVAVKAENPNGRIGIDYRDGGSVVVSHSGVDLCSGAWPAFYQGSKNATVFRAALRGSGVRLGGAQRGALAAELRRRAVPLEVGLRVPVRVRIGAATTLTVTVVASCVVTVDGLKARARVVSTSCSVKEVKI